MKLETEKIKKLGQTLRELRKQNNLSFREADRISGVDVSTISRLEDGKGHRINLLILSKLIRAYNANPISLLKIIDYITDDDIYQYTNITQNEIGSINNNEIEVLNEYGKSYYPKNFIKIPALNGCKAIKINNYIFLYDDSCLYNDELGIFNIDNKIIIAFYYFFDGVTTLKDFFSNSISMSKNIKPTGKIKGFLNFTFKK